MAAAVAVLAWPVNFFLEGGFNMSNWALAFPLDALAAASVLAYSLSHHEAIKVWNKKQTQSRTLVLRCRSGTSQCIGVPRILQCRLEG